MYLDTPSALLVPPSVPGLWHIPQQYGKLLMCEVHSRLYLYLPVSKTVIRQVKSDQNSPRDVISAFFPLFFPFSIRFQTHQSWTQFQLIQRLTEMQSDHFAVISFTSKSHWKSSVSKFTPFHLVELLSANKESTIDNSVYESLHSTEVYFWLNFLSFEIINDMNSYSCCVKQKEKNMWLILTSVDTNNCWWTSSFYIYFLFVSSIHSLYPVLCFNVTPCFKTHTGGLLRWNNEIRGISFITDFAILFQSPLFTKAAKGRKSRQISRLINWHPAPFFFSYLFSSPTLISVSSLLFTTVSHGHYHLCFDISEEKTSLGPFLRYSFFHSPLLNIIFSAFLLSHFIFFFFFCILIFCLSTPIPSELNPVSLARTPLSCSLYVYPLFSLLPLSFFHISPLYSLWFLIGFQSDLSQKQ